MTPTRMALVAVVAVVILAGCGGAGDDGAGDQPDGLASKQLLISRADFGTAWPFTVESGILSCEEGGAIVFTVDDVGFGLNVSATSQGYERLEPSE